MNLRSKEPWPFAVRLPLNDGVNAAERTSVVMRGPKGAQTPVLRPNGRPRTVRYKSEAERAWREEATLLLRAELRRLNWQPCVQERLEAWLDVYVANPQQDVDSVTKACLDAFEDACAWQAMPSDQELAAHYAAQRAAGRRAAKPRVAHWRDAFAVAVVQRKFVDPADPRIHLALRPATPSDPACFPGAVGAVS